MRVVFKQKSGATPGFTTSSIIYLFTCDLFTESCYMYQGINYDNTDWEADEAASVRVMLQYLTGECV